MSFMIELLNCLLPWNFIQNIVQLEACKIFSLFFSTHAVNSYNNVLANPQCDCNIVLHYVDLDIMFDVSPVLWPAVVSGRQRIEIFQEHGCPEEHLSAAMLQQVSTQHLLPESSPEVTPSGIFSAFLFHRMIKTTCKSCMHTGDLWSTDHCIVTWWVFW